MVSLAESRFVSEDVNREHLIECQQKFLTDRNEIQAIDWVAAKELNLSYHTILGIIIWFRNYIWQFNLSSCFGRFKGVSKSLWVLFNGIEASMDLP